MSKKYDIFSLFESLLTDEENEFSQSSNSEFDKQNKLKQAIKKRDVVSKKSNKTKGSQLKDKTEDDDIDDSEEDVDDKDKKVYDDNKGPKSINLKDALELSKQIKSLNKFKASQSLKDPEVNEELEKYFNKLSNEWWDEQGSFAALHHFNPVRLKFILDSIYLPSFTLDSRVLLNSFV